MASLVQPRLGAFSPREFHGSHKMSNEKFGPPGRCLGCFLRSKLMAIPKGR